MAADCVKEAGQPKTQYCSNEEKQKDEFLPELEQKNTI